MAIERITPDHALWNECCAHLRRHDMEREVVRSDAQLLPGMYLLATVEQDNPIGHIALRMQQICIPATEWSEGVSHIVLGSDQRPLRELFVRSFAVDEAHRRQGYGRALQLAALDLARCLGCYQLRSWSSLDKHANYALKIGLGFAVHPAIQVAHNGTPISGAYFVMTTANGCPD